MRTVKVSENLFGRAALQELCGFTVGGQGVT